MCVYPSHTLTAQILPRGCNNSTRTVPLSGPDPFYSPNPQFLPSLYLSAVNASCIQLVMVSIVSLDCNNAKYDSALKTTTLKKTCCGSKIVDRFATHIHIRAFIPMMTVSVSGINFYLAIFWSPSQYARGLLYASESTIVLAKVFLFNNKNLGC